MLYRTYDDVLTILTSERYQGLSLEDKFVKFEAEENWLPPEFSLSPFPASVQSLAVAIVENQTCEGYEEE